MVIRLGGYLDKVKCKLFSKIQDLKMIRVLNGEGSYRPDNLGLIGR